MTLNLSATPGLVYAALISPSGHLLASLGQSSVEPAIAAALTQGAMAALAELGQRNQLGACGEMTAACQNGGLLFLTDQTGNIALLQHGPEASPEQLRLQGRAMLLGAMNPSQPKKQNRQSLMEALNAGPP